MSAVFVEVSGSGPAVVLLHGWAMHGGVFAGLAGQLAQQHTVYRVDLPGHGHSHDSHVPLTLSDMVQAICAATPPQAHWLGWSLGGLVALQAAATQPQAVRHLTMLCASPCFVRESDWMHGVSPEVFEGFAAGLRDDPAGTLDRFIALEAVGSDHVRDDIRLLRQAVAERGHPSAHVLAEGLQLLKTADLRPMLADLSMPSLWLAGRRDRLVHPQAMAQAAASTPQATHAVIAGAGHAPFLTHVDAVLDALSTAWAQLP